LPYAEVLLLILKKIEIIPGETTFNPDFHEAISMEEGEGDKEIVSEELRSGYLLNSQVVRHAMVRVSK
jgi:molecular chaperone GrpE (heat shock protein)